MIELSDNERGRLMNLSQDKLAVEGLKKMFLNSFLKSESRGVQELAAAKLAIELLQQGFRELARLNNTESPQENNENPAV